MHEYKPSSLMDGEDSGRLRWNVTFNYAGHFYSTLIGILILPMFLTYVGPEAFGLIGFFTLLQAWMTLLDLGMTPTLGREVARLGSNPKEQWRLLTVANTLEILFVGVAVVLGVVLLLFREWIATDWLTIQELPRETVTTAVAIMALTAAARWIASVSRSGINAYEAQVWMNLADMVFNTLRYPGALLLVVVTGGDILAYFYYQLALVLVEVTVIRNKFRRLLPRKQSKARRFSLPELKRIAPFALSIGYTGAIWVLLTQLDKLLMSRFLTLSEFGYFMLVATIATGVAALGAPISKAILPRMTALLAAGEEGQMRTVYRRSSRLVVSIVAPLAFTIALSPEAVVHGWTGNAEASNWAAVILPPFALGGALMATIAFQYFLQYAHGDLRYHVRWNTFAVLVNVPLVVYAAVEFGALGVAWVWLAFRLFSFLAWVPFIHHTFAPGMHWQWLFKDVLPPVVIALLVTLVLQGFVTTGPGASRLAQISSLAGTLMLATLASLAVSFHDVIRSRFSEKKAAL